MNLGLIHFLKRESNKTGSRILIASVIAGIANGLVVVIINNAARNYAELNLRYLLLFTLCIAIYIISNRFALFQTASIVRNALSRGHIRIAEKIRRSSLIAFEGIGESRIFTTLAENTEIIFEASRRLAGSASAVIMLVFSFSYLAYLSSTAFWFSVVVIVCGVLVYLFNQRSITEGLHITIKKENEFFDSLNHVLTGFKELKMNRERGDDLFRNYLEKISVSARDLKIKTESAFISNIIFAQTFLYILLASIVFLLPQITSTAPALIVNLVTVILFIIGPLGLVVDALPVLAKADIAIEKLEDLENILDAADDGKATAPDSPILRRDAFEKVVLRRVTFDYQDGESQKMFSVGPLELTVNSGEVLFIVGGNGSGKTTLLKLITGLYYPKEGTVFFDDIAVNMTNYAHYRNFFSIIFSDFHLFDRLYGIKEINEDRLNSLLNTMGISEKTACIDGRFTNINLSTGQRKRLALLVALMEDKPIYVFDEVAADQDPEFRKYFYEVLLMELKKQGKTIIAVSHDDRYFHVADRVLKMDYGKFAGGK